MVEQVDLDIFWLRHGHLRRLGSSITEIFTLASKWDYPYVALAASEKDTCNQGIRVLYLYYLPLKDKMQS